jgi:MFS family permease
MDRRRLTIFFIVFSNILGAGVILPILPLFAEDEMGATVFQATLLNTAYWIAMFVAAPWIGRLSDRFGRRPVLLVSQSGTVLSFVVLIFALPLGSALESAGLRLGISGALALAFAARTLDGLTGGNITTAQAYMADISEPSERAQSLGLISAAFGLGFIFGPVFGGFLATVSLTAPFIGAAIITAGTVLLTYVTLKESLPPEERYQSGTVEERLPLRQLLRARGVIYILLTVLLSRLAFAALQSTFALYADRILFPEMDPQRVARNVGLMLAFVGVISVITQLALIRPLIHRLGEHRLVLVGIAAIAIGFLGVGSTTAVWLAVVSMAPIAFGQGVNQPSLQSILTRFGARRVQGQLLGVYQSASSMALIFGPIWGGWVFERVNARAPYLYAIPLLLLALVFAGLLAREPEAQSTGPAI